MLNNEILKKIHSAKKIGITLGGGGARGIAHIGVMKVLSEQGIEPAVYSGNSFGGLVSAFMCAGYRWDELLDILVNFKWRKILDISLKGGLMKGEALGNALTKLLPATFSELKKPLALVATSLETGKKVTITEGDLITALRATTCFPGIFEPVEIKGTKLIDGLIVDNVPVSALEPHNPDLTIAVSVNSPLDYTVYKSDDSRWWNRLRKKAGLEKAGLPLDIMIKSIEIMVENITNVNLAVSKPDITIHADLSGIKLYSFDKYKEIIKTGEATARGALHLS